MAGDWLKMEHATPDKSETLAITAAMGWDDPDLTLGKLFRIWRWFDQQTTDGNAAGVTPALLDRIVGVAGFARAMAAVGWLTISDAGVSLPNFDRHNGKTAKARALTAKRVKNLREIGGGSEKSLSNADRNADRNADVRESVTLPASPREEKNREESKVKDVMSDFQPDSPPMVLAQHLAVKIRENNPAAKIPNLQKWARAIDLMIRRDSRAPTDIRAMIDWSQADEFWKANILSADKLREKFDVLTMQSKRGTNGNGRNHGRGDSPGSTGSSTEAASNPLGRFGMRDGADWLRERDEAKRSLQKVQDETT